VRWASRPGACFQALYENLLAVERSALRAAQCRTVEPLSWVEVIVHRSMKAQRHLEARALTRPRSAALGAPSSTR
jgi:hypothetical protein